MIGSTTKNPALLVADLVVDLPGTGRVLDGVHLCVDHGETVALVGASGCGKTTLARTILALQQPVSGTVHVEGEAIHTLSGDALRGCRRRMQAVFQDPGGSLNGRMRVGTIVGEPLEVLRGVSGPELVERTAQLLLSVGLSPDDANRWPHQFSGGQKQRIAIARALSVEPTLLICDEPTSALDVSVQAKILNLLMDLQQERGMAMVMVTHDLAVAVRTCDRIAVMDHGRIVEDRPARDITNTPEHTATASLVAASH